MEGFKWFFLKIPGKNDYLSLKNKIDKINEELKKRKLNEFVKEIKFLEDNSGKNMFKGYVFFNCALSEELKSFFMESKEILLNNFNSNFLITVSEEKINKIFENKEELKKISEKKTIEPEEETLFEEKENVNVKIISGPFKGCQGKIIVIKKGRASVKTRICDRESTIENLDLKCLELYE